MKIKSMQIFAIFASVLMLTIVAMPMVAAETDYEYCDETQLPTPEITLYDLAGSEIEIINGLPYIIVETEDEYVNIPFPLSNTMDMMVDGVPITIEVDGNYLLIPTKDGIERVCISEFDVEMVEGELMLMHEVNPNLLIKPGIPELIRKLLEWIALAVTTGVSLDAIIRRINDVITTQHRQTVIVNRNVSGGRYIIRNFNFKVPCPGYRDVDVIQVLIDAVDVDRYEEHRVYIEERFLGANGIRESIFLGTLRCSNILVRCGNERILTTGLRVQCAKLDDAQNFMVEHNGRFRIRIRSDCSNSDGVRINRIFVFINY